MATTPKTYHVTPHTPGPWKIGAKWYAAGNPEPGVRICHPEGDELPLKLATQVPVVGASLYGPVDADAALIAAPPELLEALQEFASQHHCGCGHPHCNDCWRDRLAQAAMASTSEQSAGT